VSFGAVGTPVVPQVAATGLPALELSRWTAVLHAAVGWVLVVFLLRLAHPDDAAGPPPARRWRDGALAVLTFFVPFLALGALVGPELPTLGGAVVGMAAFAAVVRRRARTRGAAAGPSPRDGSDLDARTLLRAGLPYVVLLALVLVTRLVPALRAPLQGYAWSWSLLETFDGRVAPLYHPGTLLLLGFVAGGLAQGHGARRLGAAAARAGRRMAPVVLALVAMLGLSRVAVHAGLIQALAESAAGAGRAWPVLAPFVGVLGTFVTGSATSSNILFADFQQATAAALGLPIAALQGAQGFGAAVGNLVCPHNVIAGGATVGLERGEGEVLRATALPCVAYAAAGGLVLLALLSC
jgi:lactate permease